MTIFAVGEGSFLSGYGVVRRHFVMRITTRGTLGVNFNHFLGDVFAISTYFTVSYIMYQVC